MNQPSFLAPLVPLALGCLLVSTAAAVDSVVVFNEINYHPAEGAAGGEWIELHNQMAIDIDLSGWHIEDGVNFTFPEGTIIPGGRHLVVAADPAALQASVGVAGALGPFAGQLANGSELLQLRDRNDRLMDEVTYEDGGRWPLAPDGSGATLAKRIPQTTSGPPENWTSSVSVGGTPGARNFPDTQITVRSLVPFSGLWRFEASGTDLGTSWKEPAFDDSSWPGENGATLVSYWPFDGNASAVAGTDGTLVGAVAPAADRSGATGKALAFGGPSQYVEVPSGGGLNAAASGTISLWAKWNSATQDGDCCGTFGAILARQGNGLFSDNILALSTSNPATAKLVWRQSGGPAPTLITGTTTVGTGWRHIAVTFSPQGSTLYLNGVAQGTNTGSGLSDGAGVPLSIGAWAGDGGGFMNGTLDDVAIWNAPLSPEQIAELAAGTKSPLNFSGAQNAVYFSGDGRLAANDELRVTELPNGPSTHYFRTAFDFTDPPARSALTLDLAVDDGAVVWLNGTEVYRHNLPDGPVTHTTRATAEVGDAPLLASLVLPSSALVAGRNVLAIEVHQAAVADSGMVFGAALTGTVTPPGLEASVPDLLVINEVTAAGSPLQIELINRGTAAVETAGFALHRTGVSADATFALPATTLAPGSRLAFDAAALGFDAVAGDRLFLFRPGATAVADAVELTDRPQARWPEGSGPFLTPQSPTIGSANTVTLHHEIVINELMYNAPPTLAQPAAGGSPAIPFSRNPEQWIELTNTAAQAVDISGWRFNQGVDFTFPPGTSLPAGGFLVVANDPAILNAAVPGLAALGPFSGSLAGSGERLTLVDSLGNPADSVAYSDDARWPEAADAGGSSLELRQPHADNSVGESWAASDESSRSTWQTYTYEGTAAASSVGPDSQWTEFVLGLLDKGEVLLDDISVVEAPSGAAVQMLQNGSFDSGTTKWRLIGNHHGSVIDDPDQPGNKVLRLVATGSTDHMSNHAETTFANNRSVVNGRVYRISYRAKWIKGCRQLNTRLYFNRLPKTTVLASRSRFGTPGAANSTRTANLGPACDSLRHEPAVPAPLAPVTVSATANDPDGVSTMTLWSRPDGGAWTSQPMTSDGASQPRFSASLPGRTAGTVVQFYVEATDGLGAVSRLPAAGPDSRALYKVNDGQAKTNGLHNIRLVTLAADATQLFTTINLMSNQRLGATLISDEREVFYDVGLRLKGSEHSRTTSQRLGFNVGFPSAQLFRGVHRSIAIDRSESTGFGQREMLVHQMLNHCGGVPTKYHDLIQVMAPRPEYTGTAELQLGRYTDVFLDGQYENGSDGMVFEYELVYQLNSTDNGNAEGNKVPAPDSVVGIGIGALGGQGARSDDKESYRWTFLIKNNEDRDDFSGVIPFCKWMNTTGTNFTSQITTRLDVSQWLRGHAVNVLSGAGDSYGGDGSQHNVQFYVRPTDGRMLYFPHDMDAFFDASRAIVPNGDLQKIVAVPVHARTYYQHLLDIMETTYNTGYMTRWANHFGQLLPGQPFSSHLAFIGQRRTFVTNQVNGAVSPNTPFAITTNGGADVTTGASPVTLAGTANLAVRAIRINGVSYPLNWTSRTAWSVAVPVATGTTALQFQGIDRLGNPIATATDTLSVTNTGPGAPLPVVVNEWMADNATTLADPADGEFQDWIELYNPNDQSIDLAGYTLTDDLAQPAKWAIPAGTTIGPRSFLVVWADNEPAQSTQDNRLHAAFQLSASGESIGLFNAQGVAQHTLSFGLQATDVSEGFYPDGAVATASRSLPVATPGTPNSIAQPFRVQSIVRADGAVTLTWEAVAGRQYRVESKPSLDAPSWSALTPDVTATGPTATFTDPASGAAQRFYRVRRLD